METPEQCIFQEILHHFPEADKEEAWKAAAKAKERIIFAGWDIKMRFREMTRVDL